MVGDNAIEFLILALLPVPWVSRSKTCCKDESSNFQNLIDASIYIFGYNRLSNPGKHSWRTLGNPKKKVLENNSSIPV